MGYVMTPVREASTWPRQAHVGRPGSATEQFSGEAME
jgi:hypothetical protein